MTKTRRLGNSGLTVAPLALGGNVFGWTIDEATSFGVLDAFVAGGFNLIDTADVYSRWAPGNSGGESEAIIGRWLNATGNRDRVVIATKVGMEMGPGETGLSRAHIMRAVERSLNRLQIDTIDLYQSHKDDETTPLEETLGAFAELIEQGKVRAIGASNYSAPRLADALRVSRERGLPRYECLQPGYNLYDRAGFEAELEPLCAREGLAVIPYYSLAAGFLTGSTARRPTCRRARGREGQELSERPRVPRPRGARSGRRPVQLDAGEGGDRVAPRAAEYHGTDRERHQRRATARTPRRDAARTRRRSRGGAHCGERVTAASEGWHMFVLEGPKGAVSALAFTPDATGLYAAHGYTGTHAWNLADRTSVPVAIGAALVVGLSALHPDGRWAFALWDGRARLPFTPHVIDLPNGTARPFNFVAHAAGAVGVTPDGSRLVTLGHSSFDTDRPAATACQRLYGWRMTDDGPEYEWHQDVSRRVFTFGLTALGADRFATAEMVAPVGQVSVSYSPTHPAQVAVRRASDGAALAALDFPLGDIQQLLASPDGTKLVARHGTELRVWDATNWALPPRIVRGKYKSEMTPSAAAFIPSGHYLLLANGGPSVVVYDTRAWKEVRRWKWDSGALRAVAVSPDGTLAAAAGPRGTIVVWDLDL